MLSYELAATKSISLSCLARQAGDCGRGDGAILPEADVASPDPGGVLVAR